MARYLYLLHQEHADFTAMTHGERDALYQQFVAWAESLKSRGMLGAAQRLVPGGGTTVRKQRDSVVVDGPYAEMRELISGYFIVEVADLDMANRVAGECPLVAAGGAVEVRQLDPEDFPVTP